MGQCEEAPTARDVCHSSFHGPDAGVLQAVPQRGHVTYTQAWVAWRLLRVCGRLGVQVELGACAGIEPQDARDRLRHDQLVQAQEGAVKVTRGSDRFLRAIEGQGDVMDPEKLNFAKCHFGRVVSPRSTRSSMRR